jgi:hypothetical protein
VLNGARNVGNYDIYWPVLEAPRPGRQPKQVVVKKLTKGVLNNCSILC